MKLQPARARHALANPILAPVLAREIDTWTAELRAKTAGIGLAAANFQAAAPTSVEVWNVDGASHTSGLATAPTEWETRVIGFLDRAIGN